MCPPSRYSDFTGAINLLLHLTQLMPYIERRLGTFVGIATSLRIAFPKRSTAALFDEDFKWKKIVILSKIYSHMALQKRASWVQLTQFRCLTSRLTLVWKSWK